MSETVASSTVAGKTRLMSSTTGWPVAAAVPKLPVAARRVDAQPLEEIDHRRGRVVAALQLLVDCLALALVALDLRGADLLVEVGPRVPAGAPGDRDGVVGLLGVVGVVGVAQEHV